MSDPFDEKVWKGAGRAGADSSPKRALLVQGGSASLLAEPLPVMTAPAMSSGPQSLVCVQGDNHPYRTVSRWYEFYYFLKRFVNLL